MSLADDRAIRARPLRPGAWLVIVAAALVFAGLTAAGALAGGYALASFAIVTTAALLVMRHGKSETAVSPPASPERGDDPLGAIVSGLPDPAVALDREARVIALNEPARALAPALRQGDPVTLALRMPKLTEAIDRACARGEPQRVEYSERVPIERWFEAIAAPIKRAADTRDTDLVLLTFRDLTPLRRVEEMRADFVANASHELRTPLAALSGFIETLQGPARDDPTARDRFLAIMQEQAQRMARLIDDLLSLSRVELNEHRRPGARLELAPILRQVVDGLQTLARDRGVTMEVETNDELTVLGDSDELVRLFENLIENGLKYGAAGKRVEIKLSHETVANGRSEALVSVRDYGPGIAPEHLPRLTERFYRVDVRESRAQGGTGLGLALVKHILNRHRGRLSIVSAPGAGATFTIHLPVAAQGV